MAKHRSNNTAQLDLFNQSVLSIESPPIRLELLEETEKLQDENVIVLTENFERAVIKDRNIQFKKLIQILTLIYFSTIIFISAPNSPMHLYAKTERIETLKKDNALLKISQKILIGFHERYFYPLFNASIKYLALLLALASAFYFIKHIRTKESETTQFILKEAPQILEKFKPISIK